MIPIINHIQCFPAREWLIQKVWELPNRKRFYNWTYDTFKKYDYGRTASKRRQSSFGRRRRRRLAGKMNLNLIQKLVRDFMQGKSLSWIITLFRSWCW